MVSDHEKSVFFKLKKNGLAQLIFYLSCTISLDTFVLVFLLTVHCCFFFVYENLTGLPFKWESIRTVSVVFGSAVQE